MSLMTKTQNSQAVEKIEKAHEILFCLNIAFGIVTFVFMAFHESTSKLFYSLEHFGNKLLGIQETDFTTGHFAYVIPSLGLALFLWLALKYFPNVIAKRVALRVAAGIAVLCEAPAIWIYLLLRDGCSSMFPWCFAIPVELAVAIAYAWLFLKGRWHIPAWCNISALAVHCAVWFFVTGKSYSFSNYLVGPIGPVLAFSSILMWGLYADRTRPGAVTRDGGTDDKL